jgi:hypothetical protein
MLGIQTVAATAPNTGAGEQVPAAAAPNKVGDEPRPAAAAGIAMGKPQVPQQPRPQDYGQAPPPKFTQQPRPQGFGQAPPPKFMQKPRPPKYRQSSAPPQGMCGKAPNGQLPPPPTQHNYTRLHNNPEIFILKYFCKNTPSKDLSIRYKKTKERPVATTAHQKAAHRIGGVQWGMDKTSTNIGGPHLLLVATPTFPNVETYKTKSS